MYVIFTFSLYYSLNFVVVLQPEAGLRQYGTCTHYTIQYDVTKTLHKMLDKMQLYLKRQIKCYG